MGKKKEELLDFKITVLEKTSWGLVHKTFNNSIKANRADTIAEAIDYVSKNFREDYIKALMILRKIKGAVQPKPDENRREPKPSDLIQRTSPKDKRGGVPVLNVKKRQLGIVGGETYILSA